MRAWSRAEPKSHRGRKDAPDPLQVLERRPAQRPPSLLLVSSLAFALACGGADTGINSAATYDPNVARYRLLLHENPVDPGAAFRCYGGCQEQTSPEKYLACLSQCPAFEVTQGVACAPHEVPPVAACITARKLPGTDKDEIDAGYVVVAVLANIALIVALGVACTDARNCGAYYYYPAPGPNWNY